jgi:hypothetical protein
LNLNPPNLCLPSIRITVWGTGGAGLPFYFINTYLMLLWSSTKLYHKSWGTWELVIKQTWVPFPKEPTNLCEQTVLLQ